MADEWLVGLERARRPAPIDAKPTSPDFQALARQNARDIYECGDAGSQPYSPSQAEVHEHAVLQSLQIQSGF